MPSAPPWTPVSLTTRLGLLVVIGISGGATALAQDMPQAEDSPASTRSQADAPVNPSGQEGQEALDAAVSLYIEGKNAEARNALLRIVSDERRSAELLQETRLWLGEIEYVMGEFQAAEDTYLAALTYEPELRLDPFRHPPDVVAFFNAVRAATEVKETPPPPPPPPPVHVPAEAWRYLVPGGLQLHNEQPVWASVTIASVAGMGGGALGLRLWLQSQDADKDLWGLQLHAENEEQQRLLEPELQRLKSLRVIQNTLGFSALGVWGF
ncbi:MAG: hypothetical protein KDA24_08060 [Deltaproteobacteria bacterium]|nr:hypothetical protein [Deltaproteobacteria bacterium]